MNKGKGLSHRNKYAHNLLNYDINGKKFMDIEITSFLHFHNPTIGTWVKEDRIIFTLHRP